MRLALDVVVMGYTSAVAAHRLGILILMGLKAREVMVMLESFEYLEKVSVHLPILAPLTETSCSGIVFGTALSKSPRSKLMHSPTSRRNHGPRTT